MNTTTDGRTLAAPATVTVTPVTAGDRPVGAWIAGRDTAVFRPVVDLTTLAGLAVAAVAVTGIAVAATVGRRRPEIGAVTMGPGGWVSIKRSGLPPLHSGAPRPWWARLLRAHRLVAQH